ncbi:ATP-binding protein [Kaarinaea lacus]
MFKKLAQYQLLTSGFNFDDSESYLLFRFRVLNYFLLIGAFFATLIGLLGEIGIMNIGVIQPRADFIYAAVNIFLLLTLRQNKGYYNKIALAETISLYLLIVTAMVTVETDEFRMVWFYIVAYCSYLLLNITGGIVFTALSIASIIVANSLMDLNLTETAIYTAVFGLIVIGILSWASVTQLNEYELLRMIQNKKLKKSVDELDIALTEANEANKIKSIFLANMSHEIRTPMNGMLTLAQVLRTTDLDKKQLSYLKSIEHSGELLKNLIDDILDISSIEAGKLKISPRTINVRSLVNDALIQLSPQFDPKQLSDTNTDVEKVSIKCNVDDNVPDYIIVDEVRLNQVIINLISNARKFTKQGEVKLSITGNTVNADKINLHIEVSDTGIGIPEDKLSVIFESFHQLSEDRSQNKGIGLGLPISKKIIEAMGGTINVESEVGVGTRFIVDVVVSVPDLDIKPSVGPETSLHSIHALLVEDDKISRFAVKTLLEGKGHTVICAENGKEALEILAHQTVDVILMDIHMPELNGIESTKRIKLKKLSTAPIIGMTASVMQTERESYFEAGMDALLEKPLKLEQLIELIKRNLNNKAK